MKIYFPLQTIEPNRADILEALKTFMEKPFMDFEADPFSLLTNERQDQFFLNGPDTILWGRVYFKPFSEKDAELLETELQYLEQTLKQPIQPHIFFLSGQRDPASFEKGPAADYFHYHFIQSGGEIAMVVEKIPFPGRESESAKPLDFSEEPGELSYRFSRQSQLSREELAELIDLSLELKRA